MQPNTKKIITIAAAILLVSVAYYGSYLPLRKSRLHIQSTRKLSGTLSVGEFQDQLSVALNVPSPIGQEELIRQSASMSLNILRNIQDQPTVVASLVNFIEKNYEPLVTRGYGLSFGQDIYLLGVINEVAFLNTGDPKYLEAAKNHFLAGYEAGPARPQPLYGLFDVYRAEGNLEELGKIVNQILKQWPDDERTRQIYAQYLEQVQTK